MRPRSAHAPALVAAVVAASLGACSGGANPDQLANPNQSQLKVSPMPYGVAYDPKAKRPVAAEDAGKSLDEVLAVVEGRPITRRRLIRESGGRPPGIDDAQFERQMEQRLRARVTEELFVREARRIGIQVSEQRLDEAVADQKERMVKEASKTEGRPVRFEELLADRGITELEFRESIRRRGLYELYMMRVLQGLGPARPQVEMEVSPAEIRRLYRAHPGQFDVKPGVKFAAFRVKFERYLVGDASVEQAEAAMRSAAASLAEALRRGEEPATLAKSADLSREKGEWTQTADFLSQEAELIGQVFGADAVEWLFATGRRARDVVVLEEDRPEGPLVLAVLEVQEARQKSWEEISADIVKMVRLAREKRVEANMILTMASERNVVWPERVADAIIADARNLLARLDQDPILGSARFQ